MSSQSRLAHESSSSQVLFLLFSFFLLFRFCLDIFNCDAHFHNDASTAVSNIFDAIARGQFAGSGFLKEINPIPHSCIFLKAVCPVVLSSYSLYAL